MDSKVTFSPTLSSGVHPRGGHETVDHGRGLRDVVLDLSESADDVNAAGARVQRR